MGKARGGRLAAAGPFRSLAGELLMMALGIVVYAWSMMVIHPVNIIPGSVLGIAVIVNSLSGLPTGMVNLMVNLPLIALSTFFLGKKMLVYTVITLAGTSVLMDLWMPLAGDGLESTVAVSLLGGLMMGVGAGLILRAGATMGGTSAAGLLLQMKIPGLRIGNAMLLMDGVIIGAGALLLGDSMALLYSMVYTAVCMFTINVIQYGFPKRTRGGNTQE